MNQLIKTLMITVFAVSARNAEGAVKQKIIIASGKKAALTISLSTTASEPEKFAAAELVEYLHHISGAVFRQVKSHNWPQDAICLAVDGDMSKEAYSIRVSGTRLFITGGSGRAVLFAAYDLLERLGCCWFAPAFSSYEGQTEFIPHKAELSFESDGPVLEQPAIKYRKLDVEEGLSHSATSLKEMIDWMPRLRFNTLMVPLNYGGGNRVMWDNWRRELTPELKKRGLMIEVGGHGYQNFLSASMNHNTLFKKHPAWFGKNKDCKPDAGGDLVFNTSNKDAVRYLISNVMDYLKSHTEIDVFDFWPPDEARWAECPEMKALGSPLDRQAALVNEVNDSIKMVRPDVKLEMIAYQPVLLPPPTVKLSKDILVDFCPINKCFEKQIYDTGASNNASYVGALAKWRQSFDGEIGLYSYFRKYAWHSLPNICPHYIQRDIMWYASVPLSAISTYAEPGDWFTYELNHYAFGRLAWNPKINVDSIVKSYCRFRYGKAASSAVKAYAMLEEIVPQFCSIPFTRLKEPEQIAKARAKVDEELKILGELQQVVPGKKFDRNLSKLFVLLQYVDYDLGMQQSLAENDSPDILLHKMQALLNFFNYHGTEGIFVLPRKDPLNWIKRHYRIYH